MRRAPAPTRRRRRRPSSAEQVTTGGAHSAAARAPAAARRRGRGPATRASCSRSPSALLTAITSAISRMPFLMPCSWSPVRARVRKRKVSTIPATVTSDWPTPTVSTSTTSYAAASSTAIACTVARATPPRVPALGRGPDVGLGVGREPRHPGLVAEHRPAGAHAGRVDGEHADPVAGRGQPGAERLDERRLPDPGHAGDADPDGRLRSRCRRRPARSAARAPAPGARAGRLDQRDRLRDGGPPPSRTPVGSVVDVGHRGVSAPAAPAAGRGGRARTRR